MYRGVGRDCDYDDSFGGVFSIVGFSNCVFFGVFNDEVVWGWGCED